MYLYIKFLVYLVLFLHIGPTIITITKFKLSYEGYNNKCAY